MKVDKINLINQESKNTKLSNIKDTAIQQLDGIVSSMPSDIRALINEAFVYKRIPKEYLLSSILFAFSSGTGLAFKINCMGYTNYANLYFTIIGSRGDTKSEAINIACKPLNKSDSENYKSYRKELKDHKKQEITSNKDEPVRKQFLLQDATIEAAKHVHFHNPYSIGVNLDEIYFLVQKMANERGNEGPAWRNFLLQGYTNLFIDIGRKTTDSYRLENSYPTLIGSTQHQFLKKNFANGNLESGFIDRMLFSNLLVDNSKISKEKLSEEILNNYHVLLKGLINYRKHIENEKRECNVILDKGVDEKLHEYSQILLNSKKKTT
ncbi:DUF3987 domain-containing protein [Winogradskyella helgolandensis]|uniref:DUF3987 domain-containing protein n=1 Tax=Winogradskyella helgolandensis TaxID=2697010 RepID=UPI0015CE2415|nr:DUF3987 domain-containing protein [Winogradskyella helgolandensis]